MMGCYDFCGHYEWTFGWLERAGGKPLVRQYLREAISDDSQKHARDLIVREGFAGMGKYWGHTLADESPELGFSITERADLFRIDMHECPSKGFLLKNKLQNYSDYCNHCMGWIGPVMRDAGYVIDHEHNHRGQCWWEIQKKGAPGGHSAPGAVSGKNDVRLQPNWTPPGTKLDRYVKTTQPEA